MLWAGSRPRSCTMAGMSYWGSRAATATYTYGNSLIRKDGETPLFDGLGSERTVTNAGQAVTASRRIAFHPSATEPISP